LLVPAIGLHGATIGIVVGFIVTWLLRVYQTKKYFSIAFQKEKMGLVMCLAAMSILLIFYVDNPYGLVIFVLVAAGIFVLFNLALLKKVMRKITQRNVIS